MKNSEINTARYLIRSKTFVELDIKHQSSHFMFETFLSEESTNTEIELKNGRNVHH